MIRRLTWIQLVVFTLVTMLSVGYGAVTLFDADELLDPPYTVKAQFATSGGIYPRADVDLLGTNVGSVKDVRPGPGTGTTVVLEIDHGVEIPEDVTAAIGNKSAIGEQFVELTPQTSGGDLLQAGDTIPLESTSTPLDVATLLGNLEALAGSVPTRDLGVVLDELSIAFEGVGPSLGRLLEESDTVSRTSLEHVDELTSLIESARTVLDTQVATGPQTTTYLRELAGLTTRLRQLTPDFEATFARGIRAGAAVTNLLADNQEALPLLLNNLIAVTDVAADRIPGLRKTLVMFPWIIELGAASIRYCDEYSPRTGKPIAATCRYDENGDPIYSAYLAFQMPEAPGGAPYLACKKGYEGTVRYNPDGTRIGGGERQVRDARPNYAAGCTALPTDPVSPNVRGAQNTHGSGTAGRVAPFALYDPNTGLLATPDGRTYDLSSGSDAPPPGGDDGLAWLLTQPVRDSAR